MSGSTGDPTIPPEYRNNGEFLRGQLIQQREFAANLRASLEADLTRTREALLSAEKTAAMWTARVEYVLTQLAERDATIEELRGIVAGHVAQIAQLQQQATTLANANGELALLLVEEREAIREAGSDLAQRTAPEAT